MSRPDGPPTLSDLLEARTKVRENYGPGLLDELPGEAMHMLVGEFANRTPHLRKVGAELAMAAVEAVADGQTMDGPSASTIGEPQPQEQITIGDWLFHPSKETDEAFTAAMGLNNNTLHNGPIDDFGRPTSDVDQLHLPPDLANVDDFDMLHELHDLVEHAPPDDLYRVARHLKTSAPTHSGIDATQLPPEFTTPDALDDLTFIKNMYGKPQEDDEQED